MRLSLMQRKVLRCVQLSADEPVERIARIARLKAQTVHRTLQLLRLQGLLISRPMIDYSLLGYSEYDMFLRVSGDAPTTRDALREWATTNHNVVILAETGGEFEYEITFVARNVSEVVTLLSSLSSALEGRDIQRSLAVRTSYWLFGTKSLSPGLQNLPVIGYNYGRSQIMIDDLDRKILCALDGGGDFNLQATARELRVSPSTLHHRFQRLKEKRIIAGFLYDYSALFETLGLFGFHLLLRVKSWNDPFQRAFLQLCREHVFIDKLVSSIGNWDYKLLARVPSHESITSLMDDLYRTFGSRISECQVSPILRLRSVSGAGGSPLAEHE